MRAYKGLERTPTIRPWHIFWNRHGWFRVVYIRDRIVTEWGSRGFGRGDGHARTLRFIQNSSNHYCCLYCLWHGAPMTLNLVINWRRGTYTTTYLYWHYYYYYYYYLLLVPLVVVSWSSLITRTRTWKQRRGKSVQIINLQGLANVIYASFLEKERLTIMQIREGNTKNDDQWRLFCNTLADICAVSNGPLQEFVEVIGSLVLPPLKRTRYRTFWVDQREV